MMFDRRLLPPRTFYHYPDVSTCFGSFEGHVRLPFPNTPESVKWLASLDRHVHGVHATSHAADSLALDLPADVDAGYPLREIAPELGASDIVFGNLESPLSNRGRRMNNDVCYSADTAFAPALAEAGFDVVSFANNHCFDYGEVAFFDTLACLKESGIAVVGAGATLEEARRPAIFRVNGVSIAFLGYSMVGPDWIYATHDECGVVPLNPMLVGQDIARIRADVDFVVLSVHWGVESRAVPWPRLVDLAHDFIDSGADVILGHHSHVPGSVEIHRGKPIFYSLGNFSFGHDHAHWGDNMLVRLHIDGKRLARVEMLPIRGRYQPALADEAAAKHFHQRMTDVSRVFQTKPSLSGLASTIELAS